MNESIPDSVAVSDAPFMGPPVSIISLSAEASKCAECQQHRDDARLWAPKKIPIHHHPLSSGSIYISESPKGVAYDDQQPNLPRLFF